MSPGLTAVRSWALHTLILGAPCAAKSVRCTHAPAGRVARQASPVHATRGELASAQQAGGREGRARCAHCVAAAATQVGPSNACAVWFQKQPGSSMRPQLVAPAATLYTRSTRPLSAPPQLTDGTLSGRCGSGKTLRLTCGGSEQLRNTVLQPAISVAPAPEPSSASAQRIAHVVTGDPATYAPRSHEASSPRGSGFGSAAQPAVLYAPAASSQNTHAACVALVTAVDGGSVNVMGVASPATGTSLPSAACLKTSRVVPVVPAPPLLPSSRRRELPACASNERLMNCVWTAPVADASAPGGSGSNEAAEPGALMGALYRRDAALSGASSCTSI